MYGVVGYKTHAKLSLVVRREASGMRRYAHLGTGNYHPATARLYTDFGLITCDDDIGQDVHELFHAADQAAPTPKLNRIAAVALRHARAWCWQASIARPSTPAPDARRASSPR